MTETWGYVCPVCLGWWTAYLNKGENLCCGCGVKKKSAAFLYRKTYGNHYLAKEGVSCRQVEFSWRGEVLKIGFEGEGNLERIPDIISKALKEGNYPIMSKYRHFTILCFQMAYTGASNHEYWQARCPKCRNYQGKRQCHLGIQLLSIGCGEFNVTDQIAALIQMDLNELEITQTS